MEYNGISFFFICNKDTHEILRLWILVYRAGFWDMIDWSEKKSDHQKVFFGISTFTWYPVFPPTPSFSICFDFSKRHAKFDDFTGETTKWFNWLISRMHQIRSEIYHKLHFSSPNNLKTKNIHFLDRKNT